MHAAPPPAEAKPFAPFPIYGAAGLVASAEDKYGGAAFDFSYDDAARPTAAAVVPAPAAECAAPASMPAAEQLPGPEERLELLRAHTESAPLSDATLQWLAEESHGL